MSSLISVIIPTYKRPFKTLNRAINSVLNQSYNNFELIVVDDTPKGDPHRLDVEKNINTIKDNRVKYIKHEYNQGACKARNTGIIESKGEYMAFLDDDDEWLPTKLELQLEKFNDDKVGLVYCDSVIITIKSGKEVKNKIRSHRLSGNVYDKLIFKNFIGSTSFVMIKKEALDASGLFNEKLKSAQDYDLWLRISKNFKVDYVDVPLVKYYKHEGERISNNIDNLIQGFENINEINLDYLKLNPRALSIRRLIIVPYYSIKKGYKDALLKWYDAVKIYPFQMENVKYLIKIFIKK